MFGVKDPEVLVVGAGPVGLFAALKLAGRGIRVGIADREWRTGAHSYALALHARSLELLDDVGLLGSVLERAYRVQTVGLYDGANRRAEVRVPGEREDVALVAVMRQDVLENLLEEALRRLGVPVLWNHEVAQLVPHDDHVALTINKLAKDSVGYAVARTEWTIVKTLSLEVPFVIGADGHRSLVRRSLGIDFGEAAPAEHFAVFELSSDADFAHEMRAVIDERATTALWPLRDGHCRFSFQLPEFSGPAAARRKDRAAVQLGAEKFPVLSEENLRALLAQRAPWFESQVKAIDWRIVVRFERRLAEAFGRGRAWLAGDAGHTTGPVGMQSMNVGLREADELAEIVAGILREGQSTARLQTYNERRIAEWRRLLGLEGGPKSNDQTDPWIRRHGDRLLPCLPASGPDLTAMAAQLGLEA